jgi:hypothetical protein
MRYTPCFADPANLVTPEEPEAPDGETALELLRAVYRDQRQPLPVRIRCAAEALPFETPKLGAVAVTSLTANDFAAALDRAILRSGKAPLRIEAKAEPEQVD